MLIGKAELYCIFQVFLAFRRN